MQLKYDLQQPESFAGMLVDNRTNEIVTASAAEDLSFGVPVYVSRWDSSVKPRVSLLDAAGDLGKLFGFVVYEPRMRGNWPVTYIGDNNDPSGTVLKKDMEVAIVRKGVLWTNHTVGTVTAGETGTLDSTTNSLGKVQSGAAASGDVTYYGLQFLSGAAAGKLVQLQVNLPGYFIKKA